MKGKHVVAIFTIFLFFAIACFMAVGIVPVNLWSTIGVGVLAILALIHAVSSC